MKLVLQIALGVFLGTLASQFIIDSWHTYQQDLAKAASEKVRLEQNERIRALFMRGGQGNTSGIGKPPAGFVPDDAQVETPKEE